MCNLIAIGLSNFNSNYQGPSQSAYYIFRVFLGGELIWEKTKPSDNASIIFNNYILFNEIIFNLV